MWSSLQPSQLCTAEATMKMTSSGQTARPGGDSQAPPANSITFLGAYRMIMQDKVCCKNKLW